MAVLAEFIRVWESAGGSISELATLATKSKKKHGARGAIPMILRFVRGEARIVSLNHEIDCDADPYVPDGYSLVEHRKDGVFQWHPENVMLFLSDNQRDNNTISGHKLRDELANMFVMNANLLDYLVNNQALIPESWQGQAVVFWGTIYRGSNGKLCVGYLDYIDGFWVRKYLNLDEQFGWYAPACCHQTAIRKTAA